MVEMHLLLAFEEEVIDELLLPVTVSFAVEAASAGVNQVKVQHGDVGPGAEGRRELESCEEDIELATITSEGETGAGEQYCHARRCLRQAACPPPRHPPAS